MPAPKNAQNFNQLDLRDVLSSSDPSIRWLISVLDSMNNGVLIIDDELIVRYLNEEYTRITSVSRDRILGRPLLEVRPGAKLPEVVRTGRPMSGVFRREGDIEYVVDLAPIVLDGKVQGGVAIFRDITEIERLSKELQQITRQRDRLRSMIQHAYRAKYTFEDIVGESDEIRSAIDLAKRFARGNNDILITGESGTGKEILAQAVHNASQHAAGPFVTVNCAALAPTLLESELFGYVDGAFTGAKKGGKIGLFEIADGGTIFLDEIAELTPEMQGRLLRVLQERTIRRVGDTHETTLDIRVISATNRDLGRAASENLFRQDLYYRLGVLNVHLPPLRERGRDIRLLADHFLFLYSRKISRPLSFSPEVYKAFATYSWPGNIREMIHTIAFAAQMTDGLIVRLQDLPQILRMNPVREELPVGTMSDMVRNFEKKIISSRLRYIGDSAEAKLKIARELGISRATLYNKIKAYGLNKIYSKNME